MRRSSDFGDKERDGMEEGQWGGKKGEMRAGEEGWGRKE